MESTGHVHVLAAEASPNNTTRIFHWRAPISLLESNGDMWHVGLPSNQASVDLRGAA